MALKSEASETLRAIGILITPSWFSGIIAITIGVAVSGGTIVITRLGNATEQSIIGLHSVYHHSSIGASTNIIGQNLSSNAVFNNAILFVLWGSVGLVVYSVVQGIVNEFNNFDDLLHAMNYVHADRNKMKRDMIVRAIIRFAALAGWWILAWAMLHKILPYTISTAHNLAYYNIWLDAFLGLIYCILGIHGLTVLLRLTFLRPRMHGNSILDN